MQIQRILAYILLISFSLANSLSAARLVVILRSPNGDWQLQDAEKILINGKQKIRLGTAGMIAVDGEEYKRLPVEAIGSAPLRMHHAGYLVYRSSGAWQPALPDGAGIKASTSLNSLWTSVGMQLQGDKGSKPADVNAESVFAILSDSDTGTAAVDFLADESNFTGVGEKDPTEAFQERMSLLVFLSRSASPAVTGKLKQMLLTSMNAATQKTNAGVVKYAEIEQGLKFVSVSENAFPTDPQQKEAREKLLEKKLWVDRRIAILRALRAGDQNDAFIDKYGQFELYDNSFPEIRALRDEAFQASAAYHIAESDRFLADKQYGPALAELNVARLRSPGDKSISDKMQQIRDENARQSHKAKVVDLNSPVQIEITRHLALADNYAGDGKWADAENELALAEQKDKTSYRILFHRAKLLQSRKQYQQALEVLDRYDRVVSDGRDIADGQGLRVNIDYQLKNGKDNNRDQVKKAEESGDYVAAMNAAKSGLEIDSTDPFFLYHAGLNSAILRKRQESRELLKQYLAASQSDPAESSLRATVLNLLPTIEDAPKPLEGSPNWFSGYNMPANIFYCPVSLMASAHPHEIRGSRNEVTRYFWSKDQLNSVATIAQKPEAIDVTLYFEYFPGGKGVRRVSTEPMKDANLDETLKFTPQGTVGSGKGTYVTLQNNPTIDPYMVEKLTGKRVGVIVSGNAYFQPFVWDGVHAFSAEYDNQGRVVSAKPLDSKSSDPKLEFKWDGNRLMSVTAANYSREIQYSGGRIASESIQFNGKHSKIEYKYKADELFEVICDADPSLDGRSRKVTFE